MHVYMRSRPDPRPDGHRLGPPQCGNDLIEAEIDGRIRLTCTSDECNYVFWDPPTPVVAAVVEFEGKVVLARNKKWPEG